jgi:crotonobetainyl-CoA:carnitine CoA-transferase CaiB-like acyl-CoA transferase
VLQALSGLMSVNGSEASGPIRIGVPIVDIATGLSAAIAILLALSERQRSGRGQKLDVSLYDTALSLLHPHAANYFASGQPPKLTGSGHPNISPYDKYATRTGEIFLGVVNDSQFGKFCRHIGREDLAADLRFSSARTRLVNREVLRAEIERALAERDGAALCEELMRIGVPAGAVNPLPAALEHPHAAARGMAVQLDGYRGLGIPVKLSRTPGAVRRAPPAFGADNRELLASLGFGPTQVQALLDSGAVLERMPGKAG